MKVSEFIEESVTETPAKLPQFPHRSEAPKPTLTIQDEAGTHAFYLMDPGTGHVLKRYFKVDRHLGAISDDG